jgi:hypothetical protein
MGDALNSIPSVTVLIRAAITLTKKIAQEQTGQLIFRIVTVSTERMPARLVIPTFQKISTRPR